MPSEVPRRETPPGRSKEDGRGGESASRAAALLPRADASSRQSQPCRQFRIIASWFKAVGNKTGSPERSQGLYKISCATTPPGPRWKPPTYSPSHHRHVRLDRRFRLPPSSGWLRFWAASRTEPIWGPMFSGVRGKNWFPLANLQPLHYLVEFLPAGAITGPGQFMNAAPHSHHRSGQAFR